MVVIGLFVISKLSLAKEVEFYKWSNDSFVTKKFGKM